MLLHPHPLVPDLLNLWHGLYVTGLGIEEFPLRVGTVNRPYWGADAYTAVRATPVVALQAQSQATKGRDCPLSHLYEEFGSCA